MQLNSTAIHRLAIKITIPFSIALLLGGSVLNAAARGEQCGATGLSPSELVKIYSDRQNYPNFTLICAHRGTWIHRNRPQNSRASFQAAIDGGVDCIENDIRWTKDNKAVIFHDPYMDMMVVDAAGNPVLGKIEDRTWPEIQQFTLRDRLLNPTSERILSLDEFITLAKGKIVQNHEIKARKTAVGPEVYKQYFVILLTALKSNDVLHESTIKGELTSAEYRDVLETVKSKGILPQDVYYVPKFFSETPNVASEIAAFNALGITAYELVVETDESPLVQYFSVLDKNHKRYGAFDLIPESGRGRYRSNNKWYRTDPTKDFRGNWDWIFQRDYGFIISDRPCLISQYLTQLGKRKIQ